MEITINLKQMFQSISSSRGGRIRAQLFFCLRRRVEHDEKIRHVASIKLKEYQELQLWNACERRKPFSQEIKEKRTIDKIFLCATVVVNILFSLLSILRSDFFPQEETLIYKRMIILLSVNHYILIVQINIHLSSSTRLDNSFIKKYNNTQCNSRFNIIKL